MRSVILAFAAASAAGAWGAQVSPDVAFPRTAFALPVSEGIDVSWVMKPLEKDGVATSAERAMRFDVDGKGKPWFGDGARRVLSSPADNEAAAASTKFADFAFTQEGARVVCTDEYLGELKAPQKPRKDGGLPVLQFWGRVKMSHPGCRLAPAGPRGIYIIWHNEKNGDDEVSFLKVQDGAMRAVKLFAINARIAAVAGDGDTTFLAVKDWILRLPPGGGKHQAYYNPGRAVTGLAYSPEAGLFYATADAVGFVHPDFQLEFVKSPDPEIALRDDALYVRLAKTTGVVKISGIDEFKSFRWPQKKAASK